MRTSRWGTRIALAAALGAGSAAGDALVAPRTAAAQEQPPELKDSAADLIDDAKAALELAKGWVRRADDTDLEFGERREARVQAAALLRTARDKLQAAVAMEPARERDVDPLLGETGKLLHWVRKMGGIGEAGEATGRGAPPPPAERPPAPTEREAPPPAPAAPAPPAPSGKEPATAPPPAPAAPELQPVAWDAWDQTYREIVARTDLTSVARLEALRDAARGKAIELRGKVLDLAPAPARYGDGATVLQLCGVYGGAPRREFVVAGADRAAVTSWRRWDRVAWRERIEVKDVDRVAYVPVFRSVADLVRTPDPGAEYPPDVRASDTAKQWTSSLQKFAEQLVARPAPRWRAAYNAARRMAGREYAIPGEVEVVEIDGAQVRPKGTVAFETRDGRRFGPPRATVRVKITDPQVLAALAVGTPVTVGLVVEPPESALALYRAGGELKYSWRFHRLRAAK